MNHPAWQLRESTTPVEPADCALCIGIPLDRDAILRSLAERQRYGYVPGILKGHIVTEHTIEDLWLNYQTQVVLPVEAACKRFCAMGVVVKRKAELNDLARFARERRVLVLWTHWESPPFQVEEIKKPEKLVQIAERRDHWIEREVYEALRRRRWGILGMLIRKAIGPARMESRLQEHVTQVLNGLILESRKARDGLFDRALKSNCWKPLRGKKSNTPEVFRVLLEQHFQEAVQAGTCLELANGLVTAWEFLEKMPTHRWFVLDLTVCNSTELQEISRISLPRMRVIGHYQTADIPSGALLVERTLRLLAEKRQPYLHLERRPCAN